MGESRKKGGLPRAVRKKERKIDRVTLAGWL